MFNFKKFKNRPTPETLKQGLTFVKQFSCVECGNQIKLTCDKDRGDGPSNFEGVHTVQTLEKYKISDMIYIGHSIVPSGSLNWLGLLEERSWKVNPIKCPACIHGLSTEAYKQARREGKI